MTSDLVQTIIETKREELIEIMKENGCLVWSAGEFALQECIMGIPNGDYNYHNYHEHYTQRYLKDDVGDWKYGTAMTHVLQQLFHKHFSKAYSAIKNAVYEYMDEQQNSDIPEEGRMTLKDFGYDLSEMTDYVIYHELDLMENVVDKNWNIVAKRKLNKKK
jgi:hypothetical protein